MKLSRRDLLRGTGALVAAGGLAAAVRPVMSALAAPAVSGADEYFVFLSASGGWDVTLWADPRNERRGIIEPATTATVDPGGISRWVDAPLAAGEKTFRPVTPPGAPFVLGPAIGDLADIADRITLVNGLAMNTVSHPDGAVFSATGRHAIAGRVVASSVDAVLASELGREQIFPALSVGFPSYFVGNDLDRRAVPLRVGSMDAFTRLLARADVYETAADRADISAVLTEEARDLATRADDPAALRGLAQQYEALQRMTSGSLASVFSTAALQKACPGLPYGGRFSGQAALGAAFAVEAMRRNLVRCVAFASGGFDTHTANYRAHAAALQELFNLVTALVRALDATPHPTRTGDRLSDHTHILVVSEFCRTPQINQAGGRDHYPNNSALVISPRLRRAAVFGRTDVDQLLPAPIEGFSGGPRAIAPPDLLATLLHAVGVDPRKHLRDGEVVKAMLAT